MTAFDENKNIKWLFCLTHPDDDVFIGAWIRRLSEIGCEVHLSWTHDNSIRRAEARHAARLFKIPPDRLHFQGGSDGKICDDLKGLIVPFSAMIEAIKPDRVVCGAFEHGHIDHDSTNFLVSQVFNGPIFETPYYHTYCTKLQTMCRLAEPSGAEVRALDKAEKQFKWDLLACYPSQNLGRILKWYPWLQLLRFKDRDVFRFEELRLQDKLDYRRPNVPSTLAQKVLASPQWQRWLAAINAFESDQAK